MRVAVIGLGAMGSRIARRLLDAGHDVVVWNRTPARAEGFPRVAATPAEAARDAEATIMMVSNPQALREVTAGIAPQTLIEMSTVGPAAIHELAEALPGGTELLDAPVLGSRSEAEAGTLQVFVDEPTKLYEKYTPLLSTLDTTHHINKLDTGAAAKLVANSTLFGTIDILTKTLRLADRLGLSRDTAFKMLATTPIGTQA